MPVPLVRTAVRPLAPPLLGLADGVGGVGSRRSAIMRWVPDQDERYFLLRIHGELGNRGQILAARLHRRSQAYRIGSRHRLNAVFRTAYPRNDRSIIEADDQLHTHR